MFMHIISINCGPAAAAPYTNEVQTDRALRYWVFFKWQGTTEEERLLSSTHQEGDSKPLLLEKQSWHQVLR